MTNKPKADEEKTIKISPYPMTSPTTSPTHKVKKILDFSSAIQEIAKGRKIGKKEWGKDYYVKLNNGLLKLYKPDGKEYDWLISEGDLAGEDYFVL